MRTSTKTTEVKAGLLQASVVWLGSTCTISLTGELDLSNVETVSSLLSNSEANDVEMVVLDLEDLDFIDSSGIAVLLATQRRFESNGSRRLRIVPSRNHAVRRVFTLTGLDERLPFVSG